MACECCAVICMSRVLEDILPLALGAKLAEAPQGNRLGVQGQGTFCCGFSNPILEQTVVKDVATTGGSEGITVVDHDKGALSVVRVQHLVRPVQVTRRNAGLHPPKQPDCEGHV